ncbi:MAG: hypothetical protein MR308_01105 [Lachnospiraceae bacterium]|nr:hypothetical protein [Lachnospiraceae bacterium]
MIQNTTSMSTDCKKTVKVDLVCGFRGSGKTTLIKKLAEKVWVGERIVFLQNEFGRETLSRMPLQSGWYVKMAQNGCLCCSGAGLLARTFLEIIEECQPDRIVMEAAETARIESLRTMFLQELAGICLPEHTLYICNMKTYRKKMLISGQFFENELKQAPVIFLNHCEELPEDDRNRIIQSLQEISPGSMVLEKDWNSMEPGELQMAYKRGRRTPAHMANVLPGFGEFVYKGCRLQTGTGNYRKKSIYIYNY